MRGYLFAALAACAIPASAQDAPPSGTIVIGPPEDLILEVATGAGGEPVLSQDAFTLALGGYYRMNFVCPDAQDDSTGFHFEMPDLLKNAHLRVVSVGDIEIYMQGLTFHAIECDEAGAARFSFHPMRAGSYDILVRAHLDPPQQAVVTVTVD